ncbi:MAG TPA: flagellar filament capping protein FliD [Sphingomonas sp.]|jgi:flagellar hook-associated protein 2|uniref:flagellar filament capping protein FliD n=1 Tax=Sphingomonas sp. TaxID=28214 RepID=UPI002EDB7FB6
MAIESIAKTLGSGSGIDIGALVTSLVEAQFAAKNAELTKREEKLTAQVSGVSKLKSAVTGLDAALKSLVAGGSLRSKLTSSNEAAIKVSRPTGATADVSARVTVTSLAARQVSTTNTPLPAGTAFQTGTLTLRLGRDVLDEAGTTTGFAASGSPIAIEITDADATLSGIAARINAANAGVTARIVMDGANERLSISGPSGAAQAFEIAGADTGGTGQSLATLAVDRNSTATTSASRARDAVLTVDGINFTRTTNSITDLVPGATLNLVGLSTTPVTIGTDKPGVAITAAATDFVAAYNEMLAVVREQNDPKSGVLGSDNAVRMLTRGLTRLTTTVLIPAGAAGAPRTLADLGVATARDGTLSVDTLRLTKVVTDFPEAVERMFAAGTGASEGGLSAALAAIVKQGTDRNVGLDASTATYTKARSSLAEAKLKVAEQTSAVRDRLQRQFATMDARTAAYKSTQSFLDNQIKAWNRSDA